MNSFNFHNMATRKFTIKLFFQIKKYDVQFAHCRCVSWPKNDVNSIFYSIKHDPIWVCAILNVENPRSVVFSTCKPLSYIYRFTHFAKVVF